MKILRLVAVGLSLHAAAVNADPKVVTIDTDAPVLAHLGAPRNLEQSADRGIFYSCRFLFATKSLLLTMHAYTIEPRSDLTRGTKLETDNGPIFQLGLRPPVVKWQIELRRLVENKVVVRTRELVGKEAQEMDRFLVCSEVFALQPLEPWLLINGNGSDTLLVELLIDGRTVAVRRNTEESAPAKSVADKIGALASEMEKTGAGG